MLTATICSSAAVPGWTLTIVIAWPATTTQPPAVGEQLRVGEALGLVAARERLQPPPGEQADRQREDDDAGVDARPGEHPVGAPARAEQPLRDAARRAAARSRTPAARRRRAARRRARGACRSPRRAATGSQSVIGGELEEEHEVERLVERRRLAVERPLQHRDRDAGARRGRTASARRADSARRTASPSSTRVDRHRDAARHGGVQEQVRRRRSAGRSKREVLRGEQERRERTPPASVPTKMRRRRRASQASAASTVNAGRPPARPARAAAAAAAPRRRDAACRRARRADSARARAARRRSSAA